MKEYTYISRLQRRLKEVERSLDMEHQKLSEGDLPDKVAALKSLARLQARHKSLEERLEKARENHAENWSDIHAGLREELDGIADAIEKLIVR